MIALPRVDENGKPYVSYSQLKLWNETKGFNTGLLGKTEFIRTYFLGETFEDKSGYGTFGQEVENYITLGKDADKFTDKEKETLNKVETLGIFQQKTIIDFEDFYLLSFLDDTKQDFSIIRDYKTASNNSKKKYLEDDYWQLDVYALALYKQTNIIPDLEVCVIERLGNGFKGGRQALSVGENIWYIPRKTDKNRLTKLEKTIIETTKEISEYYQIFNKLNI